MNHGFNGLLMNNTNILFDLSSTQPLGGIYFHGGGEYAKTVFFKLCEEIFKNVNNIKLEAIYNPLKPIENSILEICKIKNIKVNYCKNHIDINKLLYEKFFNVFYSALPYSYTDLEIPEKTKFVYTIHGLRSLEYSPDRYFLKYDKEKIKEKIIHYLFIFFPSFIKYLKSKHVINNLNKLFSHAKNQTIITVSNHSKYSIAYFFPNISITKIKVLYSPMKNYNTDDQANTDILKSLSLEAGKYILLILGNRSSKGAYRACRVLNKLIKNNSLIPLDIKILVLGVTYSIHYHRLTKDNPRFIYHDYVSTINLEILYKNAHLFLYPTLNEGFGYPPIEAMKHGTLCACSANSSISEVCGEAVLYFNPFDEIEMSNRILQSFDEKIRNEKIEKMTEHFLQISKRQEHDLELLIQEITNENA